MTNTSFKQLSGKLLKNHHIKLYYNDYPLIFFEDQRPKNSGKWLLEFRSVISRVQGHAFASHDFIQRNDSYSLVYFFLWFYEKNHVRLHRKINSAKLYGLNKNANNLLVSNSIQFHINNTIIALKQRAQ